MRRFVLVLAVSGACVLGTAGPAVAHTGFSPDTAGPGTILRVTLNAADERGDAPITGVELFFPEGVTIPAGELDGSPGWSGTVYPDRIAWTGGTAEGDQQFAMTLGPFPGQPGRLQFKVLQTYANGDIDRWIEDWPAGAPEPDMPGPTIDLVAGGPGEVPAPTVAPSTTAPATTVPSTSTTAPADVTTAPSANDAGDDDDGLDTGAIIAIVAAVAAIGGGGVLLALRARRA